MPVIEGQILIETAEGLRVMTAADAPQGAAGPQNLFIQQTQPAAQPTPFLWFEQRADGTVKTAWIGT